MVKFSKLLLFKNKKILYHQQFTQTHIVNSFMGISLDFFACKFLRILVTTLQL